jgi:hypothetical protein
VCKECIVKGGYDEKGAPKGVLMAKCSITSHILHVKAECEIVHIDSIVSKLSACTIADNPSSIAAITNNLSHLTLATNIPVNIPLSLTVCTGELITS